MNSQKSIYQLTLLNSYAVLLMIISLFRNLTNKDFQGGWLFMLILTFFIFLILIALDFLIQQLKISKKRKIIVQVMLIILLRCKDNYVSLNKKRWKYLKEKI